MDIDFLSKIFENIIDKILFFKDRKIESNGKILTEIVDPFFKELTLVVEDYFKIFLTAKKLILENNNLEIVLSEIVELRETNLVSRIKARELIAVLKDEYKNKHLLDFANKTEIFFYSSEDKIRKASQTQRLVDIFDYVNTEKLDKEKLLSHIDFNLKRMEETWASIAQSYAHIRIKLIKAKLYETY